MLEEHKWYFFDIAVKNTVSGLHGIRMVSGIGTYNKVCCKQVDHVPDGHEIQKSVFIRLYFGTIRRIFGYNIVDFFIKKSFFVLFHAVFKEIISVILCHGREFLTDQTDMFTFPVRFGDPIKKNRQKFLKDNIHSIVLFPLAISKCKSTFACIVWEEIKVISCPVRESGKKFLLYSLPCSHINRNLRNFPGVCILNQDENIPVQTFPFNRTQVERNTYSLKVLMRFYTFGGKIVNCSVFCKLTAEKKSGFYIFVSALFKIKRYFEDSVGDLEFMIGTDQKIFHKKFS